VIDYAKHRNHRLKNIILLCPNHHQEKTGKKISLETIRRYAKDPFNKRSKYTTNWKPFIISSKRFLVHIGSNTISYDIVDELNVNVLLLDGVPIVSFIRESEEVLISIKIFGKDGTLKLHIDRGELLVATDVYDFNRVGQNIELFDVNGIVMRFQISNQALTIHKCNIMGWFGSQLIVSDGKLIIGTTNGKTGIVQNQDASDSSLIVYGINIEPCPYNWTGDFSHEMWDAMINEMVFIIKKLPDDLHKMNLLSNFSHIPMMRGWSQSTKGLKTWNIILNEVIRVYNNIGHEINRRLWYSVGLNFLFLGERVNCVDKIWKALSSFNSAIRTECNDYTELEYAQLYGNIARSIADLISYKENMPVPIIRDGIMCSKRCHAIYSKQSQNFIQIHAKDFHETHSRRMSIFNSAINSNNAT